MRPPQPGTLIRVVPGHLCVLTPLAVAAAYNHVPIIEYLLKQGAEIETKDKDGYTPLLMVCCFCWNGVLFIFHIKNPPNYFSFLVGSL